jgi:bifunctional DNA-binding transcriptional regulator/antitoxin component of YhaV-PrlF toxin-antitoxin module
VVIPALIRARAGLTPGSELEITEDELGVRLQRVAPGPKLVRVGRRLVARPSVAHRDRPVIDIEGLIEQERNRWRKVTEARNTIVGGLKKKPR